MEDNSRGHFDAAASRNLHVDSCGRRAEQPVYVSRRLVTQEGRFATTQKRNPEHGDIIEPSIVRNDDTAEALPPVRVNLRCDNSTAEPKVGRLPRAKDTLLLS
jgi:hypothetical protein